MNEIDKETSKRIQKLRGQIYDVLPHVSPVNEVILAGLPLFFEILIDATNGNEKSLNKIIQQCFKIAYENYHAPNKKAPNGKSLH